MALRVADQTHDLRAAGASAVEVNAPMGRRRMDHLADLVADVSPVQVVDLGCGAGAFVRQVALAVPEARCTGVDLDPVVIDRARRLTSRAGLEGRVGFIVADAAEWGTTVDGVLCVGASHAWGGSAPMLQALRSVTAPGGIAVVGDGFWAQEPDQWCRETFGSLPSLDGLVAMAGEAGWRVAETDRSTLAEWDHFETTWTGGVTAMGTPEAIAFAEGRAAGYARYRGVLGFAWLVLRPDGSSVERTGRAG